MEEKFKKIKVLFTIPNFDTAGSGKALLKIAQRLNKDVFVPEILCMHDKGDFFSVVKESGIKVHTYQYTVTMKPYHKGLLKCWKVSRFLKKINPDVMHSFHYASDYSEPLAAKFAGIKWVYTKKNMNWGGNSKNSWKLRTLFSNHILAQNTDMIKDFFPKRKNISLIPRGVDTKEFFPFKQNKINLFRKNIGLLPEERIVVCVANLVPVKGIEVLLETFSSLQIKFPRWKLFIVGEDNNEYGNKLKTNFKKSIKNKSVVFTGKVLNVKDYLNMAEVFVLPTLDKGRKEGSPVSLLEAMACGKNVLASNIAGIKDQLQNFKENLFKPGDIDELSNKLEFLMKSPKNDNINKGKKLMKEVIINFKIEKEVRNTEEVYLNL